MDHFLCIWKAWYWRYSTYVSCYMYPTQRVTSLTLYVNPLISPWHLKTCCCPTHIDIYSWTVYCTLGFWHPCVRFHHTSPFLLYICYNMEIIELLFQTLAGLESSIQILGCSWFINMQYFLGINHWFSISPFVSGICTTLSPCTFRPWCIG